MDETLEPQPTQQVKISQEVRNYLPTILGAIVVLAAVIGGWYLWQQRQQVAQVSAPVEEISEVTPSPSPLPVSETEATELPAAGFPAPAIAGLSLLAAALGWKLRRNFRV